MIVQLTVNVLWVEFKNIVNTLFHWLRENYLFHWLRENYFTNVYIFCLFCMSKWLNCQWCKSVTFKFVQSIVIYEYNLSYFLYLLTEN